MELTKAAEFVDRKRYNEALEIYKSMEKSAPIYFNISVIFIKKRNYEKAIKTLLKALNLDDSLSICQFALGNCYYRMRNYEYAISSYNECLMTLDKSSMVDYKYQGLDLVLFEYDIHIALKICYSKLGDKTTANFELDLAKKSYPGPIRSHFSKIVDIVKVFQPKFGFKKRKSSKNGTTINYVYLGRTFKSEIPPYTNLKFLVQLLSEKCDEAIELFANTNNDMMPIIDDTDLEKILERQDAVIFCQ
eukprot:NODE_5_length_72347_cov_1.339331.p35 type:complete len:247 gc:universal NODE_5_length_72347_cov_1.339331:10382-11122(+)